MPKIPDGSSRWTSFRTLLAAVMYAPSLNAVCLNRWVDGDEDRGDDGCGGGGDRKIGQRRLRRPFRPARDDGLGSGGGSSTVSGSDAGGGGGGGGGGDGGCRDEGVCGASDGCCGIFAR